MPRDLPLFTHRDVDLCEAAASLAYHQPAEKCAGHLAPRLEDLARRIAATLPAEPEAIDPSPPVPLEAMDMTPEDIVA